MPLPDPTYMPNTTASLQPVAPTAVPGVVGAVIGPGEPGSTTPWTAAPQPAAPPPVDLSGAFPGTQPPPAMPQPPPQPTSDQDLGPGLPPAYTGPANRGGPVKNALTRMLYGMGQAGLQHVGLPTDYDIQKEQFQQALQARTSQIQQMHEQLAQQAQKYNQTLVTWTDPRTGYTYQAPQTALTQIQKAALANQGKTDVADIRNAPQYQKNAVTAAGMGYKIDPTTNQPVPRTYDDLSPQQQALYDYKQALTTAEPQKIQLAAQRLAQSYSLGTQRIAQGWARIAQSGPGGNAPADRLRRGDLAYNAQHNIDYINDVVGANPDLFGKVAGRFTTTQQMIGSDDPAIRQIGVAVHNLALASNGAHGLRSQQAVTDTENEILNHFRDSPQAMAAGLGAMKGSLQTFIDDTQRGKGPSGGSTTSTPPPSSSGGDFFSKHGGKPR
jgi:hypothetical protein